MRDRGDNRPRGLGRPLPAWAFSVLTHSLVLALALWAVDRTPRGAADEPARQAGIVVKSQDQTDAVYEGEEDQQQAAEQEAAESQREALTEALPDAAEASDFSEHLPSMLSVEAQAPPGLGPQSAAGMTRGGGGGRVGGLSGDAARVSVFGVVGEGQKFVYAFDRSVSMTGAPLAAAKRQLVESLASLGSTHQFQIIFFNHRVTAFDLTGGGRRTAFASDKTRRAAERFVSGISADGGTDRYQALRRALALEPDVVFFLTDADDAMTTGEINRLADYNERVGATICAIEFGRGPAHGNENFLVRLARMTGGQYGYIDTTRLVAE